MKIDNQHPKRKTAIEKLKSAMRYPGMHSILVLGDSGTGKTHWIEKIAEDKDHEYFQQGIYSIYGGLTEDTSMYWESVIEEAHGKVLLIEEVEKLANKSQDLLFNALSTTTGYYGFKEKKCRFVLIFTSTFPIKKLRDDRRFLTAKFFDRISQFVIEFPNFDTTQTTIFEDFRATWDKMKFNEHCPESEELKIWLRSEAYRIYGNFRDLDKITVNWNMYQLQNKPESEILELIKQDFKNLLHNPAQKVYEENTFIFDEDSDYGQMLQNFRTKLKKWALAVNENNMRQTAKMLRVSHRTMERW